MNGFVLYKNFRQDLQDLKSFYFSGFQMKPKNYHPPCGGNIKYR